jgi:hypothetical protein
MMRQSGGTGIAEKRRWFNQMNVKACVSQILCSLDSREAAADDECTPVHECFSPRRPIESARWRLIG